MAVGAAHALDGKLPLPSRGLGEAPLCSPAGPAQRADADPRAGHVGIYNIVRAVQSISLQASLLHLVQHLTNGSPVPWQGQSHDFVGRTVPTPTLGVLMQGSRTHPRTLQLWHAGSAPQLLSGAGGTQKGGGPWARVPSSRQYRRPLGPTSEPPGGPPLVTEGK